MANLRFGIIGGDKRQIALAESLILDKNSVYITGFDRYSDSKLFKNTSLERTVQSSDYIILPVPISRDKINLNTPLSSENIEINSYLKKILEDKKIFCYDSNFLISIFNGFKSSNLYDFSQKEDFLQKNAVLTAEGAIDIAIQNYEGSIYGSSCLICGFGRIGKFLAPILKNMGATVSVSARKLEDIFMIKSIKCNAILTSEISSTKGYDLIFNTIPSLILDQDVLSRSAEGSLIIDLASLPGGVDKFAADKLGIKVIHALGIPGKISPKSSGKIIKNTIYNMIQEENL